MVAHLGDGNQVLALHAVALTTTITKHL